jgi:hypothetical protein
MTRICLLGLPRCGSQYISSLFMANIDDSIKDLAEPFTPGLAWHCGVVKTEFDSYDEQVSAVIDKLKLVNDDRSLIMKLFLHSWLPLQQYIRIVTALKELGFTFVIIKRKNTVEQLLSLGIGLKLNKFSNFGEYDNSVVELDNNIISSMKTLQNDIINFDNILNQLQIDAPTLYYETIHKDLAVFLNKPIHTRTIHKKMSGIPSTERISNISEVLDILILKK